MITAIIAVRLSSDRLYDEVERIDRIARTIPQDLFRILVVDYGTSEERRHEIADVSGRYNHLDVFRVDERGTFSIGRARDIGVQRARTPVVMFHDVDFLCTAATYRRIHERARARNLDATVYDFFCVPTLYLTHAGTEAYLESRENGICADTMAHGWYMRGESKNFEHCAMGSSALVINRYGYLALGGHDPSFVGHGAEDFELYHRLAAFAPRAPRPEQYYENITDTTAGYKGFRAYFALLGLDMWMAGICTMHLHHPRREATDESYHRSSENFKLMRARMMEFDKTGRGLPPLADPYISEKTLLLMSSNSMPARSIRMAIPSLGEYEFIPEEDFAAPGDLTEFVRDEGYTQVLFLNPYGNPHRLALYTACRSEGLRAIAFDRGALPDSWFFDSDGFLGSSAQYKPDAWDIDLPPDRLKRVREWIADFRRDAATLESNEARQGVEYWRRTLGIGKRKVILVALQRPADTATVFFAGPVGSADTFNDWVRQLSKSIDRRKFVIVVKKHPLESERPDIDGVIFPRDSANINDLIELSSVVVAINSGVGLISLIEGKPVVACGHAFYQHEGLAYQANSVEELVALVNSDLSVSSVAVERFTSHLIEKFYSFGAPKYHVKEEANGATRKIAYHIDFHSISMLGSPQALGSPLPKLSDSAYVLKMAGYSPKKPAAAAKPVQNLPAAPIPKLTPRMSLAFHRKMALYVGAIALAPVTNSADRRRMTTNPLDFFQKAKWWPNRLLGRLVLDKSQRPY